MKLFRTFFTLFTAMLLWANATPAQAQDNFLPQAINQRGEPFDASQLRGKVTVYFFWATTCAVCRDSLPELRANLAGWRDKPFALVTVNVDVRIQEWLQYEHIVTQLQTQMTTKGLVSIHQDARITAPGRLPLTLLVDATGKIVARYEGRLAPEVWDGVADLLL